MLGKIISVLIFLVGFSVGWAEDEANPKVLIEPSSTKVSLAKAELTVGPLECKAPGLCGTYAIKVTPFTFKNDNGNLALNLSKIIVEKMEAGEAVEFTGTATSSHDGKTKEIKGATVPSAKEAGMVNFVVTTEDGQLVFNSSYRIVR